MSDQFEWKAEITFKGNPDEFNEMAASLSKLLREKRMGISIPGWKPPRGDKDGKWPVFRDLQLSKKRLMNFANDVPPVLIKPFPDIDGGITNPHFHLEEGIALLDQVQFKEVVGEIARELAVKQVESIKDHAGMMKHLNRLAEGL